MDSDGESVRLSTKKSGTLAERQMWKLEVVEAQPNYLTEATRDAMMEGWKKTTIMTVRGAWVKVVLGRCRDV